MCLLQDTAGLYVLRYRQIMLELKNMNTLDVPRIYMMDSIKEMYLLYREVMKVFTKQALSGQKPPPYMVMPPEEKRKKGAAKGSRKKKRAWWEEAAKNLSKELQKELFPDQNKEDRRGGVEAVIDDHDDDATGSENKELDGEDEALKQLTARRLLPDPSEDVIFSDDDEELLDGSYLKIAKEILERRETEREKAQKDAKKHQQQEETARARCETQEEDKPLQQPRVRQEKIISKQEVARMIEALKAKRMMDPDDPQNNKMTKQRAIEIEAFYRKNRSLTKGQVVKIFMEVYQLHRSSLRRLLKRIEEGRSIRQSKKGRVGRKAVQLPQETVEEMIKLARSNLGVSIQALAKRYNVDRRVVKRYLDEAKIKRFSSQELRMMRFALAGKDYKPWNPKEVEEDKQKVRDRIKKYQARKKAGLVNPQNNHNWRRKLREHQQRGHESIITTITPEEMNAAVIMSEAASGTSVIGESGREAKTAVENIAHLLPTSSSTMPHVSTVVTLAGQPLVARRKTGKRGQQRQAVNESQVIGVHTIQLNADEVAYQQQQDQEQGQQEQQQQVTYQIQYPVNQSFEIGYSWSG